MKKRWKKHCGRVLDSKNGYDVIHCQKCGFKHIIPIPTNEALSRYYKKHFYDVKKPAYFIRQKKDLDWWNMVYEQRYRHFEQYVSPKRRRLLDVGSGPGFFLKLGKALGWDVFGIEPSLRAAMYARKFNVKVINDFLHEGTVKQAGTFDVVHMQSVLEHLQDPRKIITLCYRLLKPGGIFYIVVANEYNPLQEMARTQLGYKPWWVVPPEHINYFSKDTLKKLVIACSFKILHITASFPMELFLLMGDNYIGNAGIGRRCHLRRKNFESSLTKSSFFSLKEDLYRYFAQQGIGRHIVLTAAKPSRRR